MTIPSGPFKIAHAPFWLGLDAPSTFKVQRYEWSSLPTSFSHPSPSSTFDVGFPLLFFFAEWALNYKVFQHLSFNWCVWFVLKAIRFFFSPDRIVLLVISVYLLVWGWATDENLWSIPRFLVNFSNSLQSNWVPLSEMRTGGTPNWHMMLP